jgi:uncharacterized protein YegP (UPF0339 family)
VTPVRGTLARVRWNQPTMERTMAAKFELYNDKGGKFRFRLKAANGQVIAASEAYNTKAAAKNGIASIKKNAAGAEVVEV